METLTVYKTNRGRYAVRPAEWSVIFNKYGRIQEDGFNHIAIFENKEDADFFVKAKEAEEHGKLLKLPCKPGDTVYVIKKIIIYGEVGDNPSFEYRLDTDKFDYWMIPLIGKTVLLTEQKANDVLERMKYDHIRKDIAGD